MPRSIPGRRSRCGSARWKPVPDGCEPVARTTIVDLERGDLIGPDRRIQLDRDLQSLELALVPGDQFEDLAAPRLHAGQAELAAEQGRSLGQRHPMAALSRDPRRLEPGRPAAHDQDPARPRRRREAVAAPFELAPGRWIDQAGDPVVALAPAPAQLVAGDAAAHVLGPVRHRLGGEMRIGDLAAHDADHVGLARGDHGVGVLGRADMALGLDPGVPAHLLQRLGEGRAELVGVQTVGMIL